MPPRKASEFLRIYGTKERVEWVKSLPSIVSGRTPCVNAHTSTGGMGRKADYTTIVPLTHEEHEELHRKGQRTFEAKYRVDLREAAQHIERYWQSITQHNRSGHGGE
jgi:hypothetical protein